MLIAYAKGARTFERHIDIDHDGVPVSAYCSLPEQVDEWFKAFNKAKEMCGPQTSTKRTPTQREVEYLDGLVRGVYFKTDLPAGHRLRDEDIFLAIPLLHGQLSCRELIAGDELQREVKAGDPLTLDDLDNPYSRNPQLRQQIERRGLPR
jgi:N-acetylneuraminate synthase